MPSPSHANASTCDVVTLHPKVPHTVALVMPVHGPLHRSRPALDAVAALSPPPDELIVIADVPVTELDLKGLPANTRITHVPFRSGPARARNAGAALASSRTLLFVDADVVIRPDTIERVRSLLDAHPEASALFGSYDDRPADPGFLSQYRNLLHHFVHQQGNEQASTFWAGLGAIRREAFEAVGGFDPRFSQPSIEDIELGCRIVGTGRSIRLVKDLQATHLKRWTATGILTTDLLQRGIPWTRLILSRRQAPKDLSLDRIARLSTIAAFTTIASAILVPWYPVASFGTLAAILSLILLNLRFYSFLTRQRGLGFALGTIPWHGVFYLECGLAAALGTLLHLRDLLVPTRSPTA